MPGEFRVNGYQNNWQFNANIATFADGSFMVVWDSYLNNYDDTGSATYISSQRYDASGRPVGLETVIFGAFGTSSETPAITVLSDGGYVVAWEYDDYDDILSLDTEIWAKVYNADGTVRADPFRVDTVASNNAVLPSIAARGDGGFTVFFGADRSTGNFDEVYSRNYTANGVALGNNALLNTNVGDFEQILVRSATLTNGTVISLWNSEASFPTNGDLDSNELRGSLISATGQVIRGDFSMGSNIGTVASDSGYGYDVCALANGGYVVSQREWSFKYLDDLNADGIHVLMQFYDAAGNATSQRIAITNTDEPVYITRIAELDSGDIVVVWEQYPETPGEIGEDIYGRVFTSTGVALTGVFEIGQDRDAYDSQVNPELRALAGGGFVVVYESDTIDNDNEGIAGRIMGRGTDGNDRLTVDASGSMAGLKGNDVLTGN
ncbi:MAG: hypothetical protein ACRC14_04870, partial [Paracoccaceae bacterium]